MTPADVKHSEAFSATEKRYTGGEYLSNNPTWHVEDSPWKARQVLNMLMRHGIRPATVCEVGCGAGEVLNQLHRHLPQDVRFVGYDVSPQAHELAAARATDRLTFRLGDFAADDETFELAIALDVMEHVEDYFSFLRQLRRKGSYKVLHIPLDIYALSAVGKTLMRGRKQMGHLHYFTRDTALAALAETGYDVIDSYYTWASVH